MVLEGVLNLKYFKISLAASFSLPFSKEEKIWYSKVFEKLQI